MKKKLAKKAVRAAVRDEGCDTVEKSLEELSKLKKYGFSEEEIKYKLVTKGNIIKIAVHFCLFKVLRDFSKNNLSLPETYKEMRTKITFKKKGNTISIKKGLNSCYAPSLIRILLAQFIEKLRNQYEIDYEKKREHRLLIISIRENILLRTKNGIEPYKKKIEKIICHFHKPDDKYKVIIWFRKLEKTTQCSSYCNAIQYITEIDQLLSLFKTKGVKKDVKTETVNNQLVLCRMYYKVLGLKIELTLSPREAGMKNSIETILKLAVIPLLKNFV